MRLSWIHRFDFLQVILIAALAGLGLMTLYSASQSAFHRQLLFAATAVCVYVAACAIDYRRLARVAPALYILCLLLLLAVSIAGHTAYGAQRWIPVVGFKVEPSELAKLLMLIVLAAYLAGRERMTARALAGGLALGCPPMILVLLQPDLGTSIVFGALLMALLFLGGAAKLQLAGLAALVLAAVPLAPHILHGYQRKRLEIFLDPTTDPLGAGYNLIQARIAVGSGGVFGQGWLHGAHGSLGYVPERTTDFVFAVYAEQFGLAGCLLLLALFALLAFRLTSAAAAAPDRFGYLLCAGAATILVTQVVQNVGMNIGVTPIAGIPLPFISHGGSALLTNAAVLGLVQSVMLRRRLVVHRDRVSLGQYLLTDSGTVRVQV